MSDELTAQDLTQLIRRVFQPTAEDSGLAIIADLPDDRRPDNPRWRARRAMAAEWAAMLTEAGPSIGLPRVTLAWYRNTSRNNADLPETCVLGTAGTAPDSAEPFASRRPLAFADLFDTHSIVLAPTEFSATAPLKMMVRGRPLRAATMPGFSAAMIPALRVDYTEVNRRCDRIKALVDAAESATVILRAGGVDHKLIFDLRHRRGTASGGLFPRAGAAGNLPSGETYIVPYEGERPGDPSRTSGTLPVQFGDEVVVYRVVENRAREVLSEGPHSEAERSKIAREPAYANLAEFGLGVLVDFGLEPTGSLLLDEKLGFHLAFGRSDHFGGRIGPADFSGPEAVEHIDRVYIPAMQPEVELITVLLDGPDGRRDVMRRGAYCGIW